MTTDLMKPQVIQGTTTTRSAAVPASAKSVSVGLSLGDPSVPVLAELQGLSRGVWRPLVDAAFPGPAAEAAGGPVERVRLVIDPSAPVSAGATITVS